MTELDKVKDRAAKLKAQMESAQAIGSTHEAEAFAAVLNRLLLEHELSIDDVTYAEKEEPIVERRADLKRFNIDPKNVRLAWQDDLATLVANANMCKILVHRGSNVVWFVGTERHAEVAEYMWGTLVVHAAPLADQGYAKRWHELLKQCARCGKERKVHGKKDGRLLCPQAAGGVFKSSVTEARGYIASFLNQFVASIGSRLREERRKLRVEEAMRRGEVAYAETVGDVKAGMPMPPPNAPESGALMRLDKALQRVDAYVSQRYGKKGYQGAGRATTNDMGAADGKAAAKNINFTKGVRDGKLQRQIGDGK